MDINRCFHSVLGRSVARIYVDFPAIGLGSIQIFEKTTETENTGIRLRDRIVADGHLYRTALSYIHYVSRPRGKHVFKIQIHNIKLLDI